MTSLQGRVVAVCVSDRTGIPKRPIEEGVLEVQWGIAGDAHAGDWHRQVSLLALESIEKMRAQGLNVRPGSFAENITTEGLELPALPLGTTLRLGTARVRVTQIGKICHTKCAIYYRAGDCVMPREGIFVEVLDPGTVKPGDAVEVIAEAEPWDANPDGTVAAVCLSGERGTSKQPVDAAELRPDWGLVGDAHAGPGARQVALLAWESIEKALARGLKVGPGSYAENITTRGLDLMALPIGARLRVGYTVVLEVTQHGKPPHEHDVIHALVGDSLIPREGIFARVVRGGNVRAGDPIFCLGEDDGRC
ncbi:MAG: MOSC domain-containing protein [Chloroflexota bacterium]